MEQEYFTRNEHNEFAKRMSKEYLSNIEHKEYSKRMEDEHDRQNARIKELEDEMKQLTSLTIAVEKLAGSVEHMCKELALHGTRLKELESRDGDKWRKVSTHAITAIVGAVIAYFLARLGM